MLTGSAHLGKASFIRGLLSSSLHEADFMEMDPGIDGARSVVEFCRTEPVGNSIRAVLIDDADRLGEPAQDALLKLTEDNSCTVVMVTKDVGLLQPALASRIRTLSRWASLERKEMCSFAESLLLTASDGNINLASGIPGIYKTITELSGFDELFNTAVKIGNELTVLDTIPVVIEKLETGPSITRDSIIHVLRLASRNNTKAAYEILKFCGVLSSSMSSSAGLHWMNMIITLSM